jgi:ABC-type nitrate/sulfonate/bicarbonate transport system substrate-binding protein
MGITIRLSAIAALSLAAFGAEAQQMSAVTQLGWLRNGEYAQIMMAEAKGYFKEEGIDHKIVDGGPGKNPIPIVAVSQAQFVFQQARTGYLTSPIPARPSPS